MNYSASTLNKLKSDMLKCSSCGLLLLDITYDTEILDTIGVTCVCPKCNISTQPVLLNKNFFFSGTKDCSIADIQMADDGKSVRFLVIRGNKCHEA